MNACSLCGGFILVAVGLSLAVTTSAQDKSSDLAVIVNKAVGLNDVSISTLSRYFKGEKTKAPDGTKMVVVMFDLGHAERAAALKGIYKLSESEYNDYFVCAIFTGSVSTAPRVLASGGAIKEFVASTTGGISYVMGSDVDDSVKVLKIDGKSPGDPDYPLRGK